MSEGGVKKWIGVDETAKEMLGRVLKERPVFYLPPPLHRIPLRVGNVVEITGPSPSAKTHILIQAAVSCILPKEWMGIRYGGLEHSVLYIDLDCRFDISRLLEVLKSQINDNCFSNKDKELNDVGLWRGDKIELTTAHDEELLELCLKRFSYIRCYDTSEFLASLKTLHHQLQKEKTGVSGHLLIIDSIGAFHWVDRAVTALPFGGSNRKNPSFQNVFEAVVQEMRKLLFIHPMLLIVSKAAVMGTIVDDIKRHSNVWSSQDTSDLRDNHNEVKRFHFREYMPSVWQSFVTHRLLVQASDDRPVIAANKEKCSFYISEWLLPSLNLTDKFVIKDAGIFIASRSLMGVGTT